MFKIGGALGFGILNAIASVPSRQDCADEVAGDSKLQTHFGDKLTEGFAGKTIIDFGCGAGREAVSIAQAIPDCRVIGLDVQQKHLDSARAHALNAGVDARCHFDTRTDERADLILSFDAFEHFSDPGGILEIMSKLLKPEGEILASFGPTWLHPYGGHLFSVFPWAHLVFTEKALIRWRSRYRSDGATRFEDVEGGLNQIRIYQFERLVQSSSLGLDWLETVPIRGVQLFRSRYLREFGSSLVRCRLLPRERWVSPAI